MKDTESMELSVEEVIGSSSPGIGYPPTQIPREARRNALDALEAGQTHYASVSGIDLLRDAVVDFLACFGLDIPSERVIVTGGCQEARFLALQGIIRPYVDTLLARGDRKARYLAVYDLVQRELPVAIPAVVSPGVRAALAVRHRQVTTMRVDKRAGFLPELNAIERALEGGSRLIYLESPSQLTGFAYGAEQVDQIVSLLEAYDALCVVDQSTAPAVVKGYISLSAAAPERVAAVGQLWPGIGLESWQIGYVAAPELCLEALLALKQVLSICTSTPVQWAAVGAAQVFERRHAALAAEMQTARDQAVTALGDDWRMAEGDAVNVLAFSLGDEARAVRERLVQEGIETTSGEAFGAPGVVRVTVEPWVHMREALSKALRGGSADD